jgi:hypothetical protein
MAHVKWLASIRALTGPFEGFQQTIGYRIPVPPAAGRADAMSLMGDNGQHEHD